MDSVVLPPKLEKLRKRVELARSREAEARVEAEKLERKLVRRAAKLGIDIPFTETRRQAAAQGRHGISAIREVIAEEPERVWTAADVHARLQERGWISPTARYTRQGIEAAISRLVRAGELDRIARGRYRAPAASRT
ncbi:MAG: hypothetical protein U0R50_15245 [Gaiellales bacterium]